MLHTRELSNAELLTNYLSIDNEPPLHWDSDKNGAYRLKVTIQINC